MAANRFDSSRRHLVVIGANLLSYPLKSKPPLFSLRVSSPVTVEFIRQNKTKTNENVVIKSNQVRVLLVLLRLFVSAKFLKPSEHTFTQKTEAIKFTSYKTEKRKQNVLRKTNNYSSLVKL